MIIPFYNAIGAQRMNSGGPLVNTKSLSFDGADDYIDCGNGSELQITSDISVSCWFKTSTSGTGMLISKRNNAVNLYGYQLYISGVANAYYLRFLVTLNGIVTYTATGSITVDDGQWHHVLGTINQNTQISIILDGSTEASNSIGPESFIESNSPLQLGYQMVGGSSYYFNGLMDEVSIFDALVSSSDLRKDGKPANLASVSNLVAWYRMGDNSTYQTPQILMPESLNKDKVSNFSMAFDGVDDQIQFTKTGIDTAISVSCWVKTTHVNVGTKTIVCEDDGSGVDRNWNISIVGTQKLSFDIWHTDLTSTQCLDPLASRVQDGAWHHILGTWDGTTNADSMKLYVDGGLVDSNTPITTGVTLDSTLGLSIGALQNNINWNFNGSIDEVAVWDSGIDISSIWDGSGTPTDLSSLNPLRYIKLGEESKFTSQWLVPNSALSNYSKFSFDFDGVDDYIEGTSPTGITTAISISIWVKTTTVGATQWLISEDRTGGTERDWTLLIDAGNKVQFIIWNTDGTLNSFLRSTALEVQDGNWHHILCTYDGTANADGMKTYVDGGNLESATASSTGIRNGSPHPICIGAVQQGAGYFYTGLIDEAAVWNSVQDVSTIWNGGQPADLTSLSPTAWWRLGEDATYNAAVGVSGNTTADDAAGDLLIDTGVDFTTLNVEIGDLVHNTTTSSISRVNTIAATQLTLDDAIFPPLSSPDGYKITGPVVWTVPDQIGSNDGTSANMAIQDLQGEASNYSGAGTSSNMYIEDRVGNAPNSENNAVSYNMYPDDIDPDVP